MVKSLPEFEYFYCVLENKNIISKIRRSKVTDYAALSLCIRESPKCLSFANSEDWDKMQHNAAFYQGLHCLLR